MPQASPFFPEALMPTTPSCPKCESGGTRLIDIVSLPNAIVTFYKCVFCLHLWTDFIPLPSPEILR